MDGFVPPIKLVFSGDQSAARSHIKFATNQLAILERQMSFQGLNEGRRVVSPYRGVMVECISSFSRHEVKIHVDPTKPLPVEPIISIELAEKLKYIFDENEQALFFIRIKFPDPDNNYYEAKNSPQSLPELESDRIMLFKTKSENEYGSVIPDKIVFDVDVIQEIVYYPADLSIEENDVLIAKAELLLERCPSHAVPEPEGVLKDWTAEWFISGELSDPVKNSRQCFEENISTYEVEYEIDEIYVNPEEELADLATREYCCMMPGAPTQVIDSGMMAVWADDWCPYLGNNALINMQSYNWFALGDIADGIIGTLVHPSSATTDTTIEEIVGEITGPFSAFGPSGFMENYYVRHDYKRFSRAFVGEDIKESLLSSGRWFTNIDTTEFSSFFVYQYGVDTFYRELEFMTVWRLWDSHSPTWDWYSEGVFGHFGDYWRMTGIRTPLEDIQNIDFLHTHYPALSCSESPCAFSTFPSAFSLGAGGYQESDWDEFTAETPCIYEDEVLGGTYGMEQPVARGTSYNVERHRTNFHISVIESKNFISLSHWTEERATAYAQVPSQVIYGNTQCDEEQGQKIGPYASFGYIVYVFNPSRISWIEEEVTYYWDIHSERGTVGVINKNRQLNIEEYFNTEVGKIQEMLDGTAGLGKIQNISAYPLVYYGYGITDGFLDTSA